MTSPRLDAVFDVLPFGLMLLDGDGRILRANAAAGIGTLAGERLEGRNLFDDFPDLPDLHVARARFQSGLRDGDVRLLLGNAGLRIRIASLPGADGGVRAAAFVEALSPEERLLGMEAAYVALQRLVAEARHEVNNPLMGLMGQLELLQMRAELPGWVREKINAAMHEAERIRDRLKQLQPPR